MRFIVLIGLLLAGLLVAGCGGVGRTLVAPTHPVSPGQVVKVNSASSSSGGGINSLIKTDTTNARARSAATPTTDEQTKGPMSCFDQRLQQLRQGDLLPTNGC